MARDVAGARDFARVVAGARIGDEARKNPEKSVGLGRKFIIRFTCGEPTKRRRPEAAAPILLGLLGLVF